MVGLLSTTVLALGAASTVLSLPQPDSLNARAAPVRCKISYPKPQWGEQYGKSYCCKAPKETNIAVACKPLVNSPDLEPASSNACAQSPYLNYPHQVCCQGPNQNHRLYHCYKTGLFLYLP